MAWYYGVNNSELYGSNFSTVLADAPPPLDDTYEEDENEIVFRNEVKKSKKYNGETVSSSITKGHSSDEKFHDKSKPDDSQLPNGEDQHEGQGSVEEDSDFGDFAGFADFSSAFGQENSGESQNWFSGNENNRNSPQAVKAINSQQGDDVDDEYADFAAFQDSDSSLNQENVPNGGSEQENSNTSEFYKCDKNGLGNRINSINGSNDMDSDDDFGDFSSVEKTSGRPVEIAPENDSVEIQPDLEKNSTSQRRTCSESDKKSGQVDKSCERNIAQCNGDIPDENVASHLEESTVNHTSEDSPYINKRQENELGTNMDNNGHSSVAVKQGDSSMAEPEREKDQIKNNVEGSRTNTVLSNSKEKENSESVIKSDDVNATKANFRSSSTCDHDSEAKILPANNEESDDEFGEFADFADPPTKQPSMDNDDDEEIFDKGTPDSPEMSAPIAGKGNEDVTPTRVASVQGDDDDDDDDEFGDFGSFDKRCDSESATDFATVDSKAECLSTENNDDDDFGDFGISNSEEKTSLSEEQENDNFGDFDTFNSETKDSNNDDDKDDFGEFGSSNSEEKPLPSEEQENDNFGDFGTFNSETKDSNNDDDKDDFGELGMSNSEEKPSPSEDQDDDFGDFGTLDSSVKDSQQENNSNDDFEELGTFDSKTKDSNSDNGDDFGNSGTSNSKGKTSPMENQDNDDFGTFNSSTKDSKRDDDSNDDFGDFGNFESNTKDDQKGDFNSDSFAEFGAFDAKAKDSLEKNESDNEFGDFGTFESKVNDVPKKDQRNSNEKDFNTLKSKDDTKFGDFRTSDPPQNSQMKKTLPSDEFGAFNSSSKNVDNSRGSDNDFGDFSSGKGKEGSFTPFPASHSSVSSESFPKKNEDLKQRATGTSYFVPGNNVIIKQVGDPIALCFISELRHISDCQCDVLSSRVEKSLQSNLGLWQQLERSDKEGRILFNWSNSFTQHKKLLSLMIRPDRPPPLQGGSMLKPMVSSQFAPFGGGLAGSMLMPEPSSKFPHFSSGLGFLEPVKGSQLPVQSTIQEKIASHQSVHPEIGLPDLSFVLGNGIKRTASKSDIKDNVSDTASESSSLDLDFFAPSTTQPSDGKSESRGLYEEDLLGLNIFASSVEPQKLESPKLQKTSDTKRVWQHGGVTIPLSSQESRAQLSAAAKSILDELEDLRFMTSSVLMFPLKPE